MQNTFKNKVDFFVFFVSSICFMSGLEVEEEEEEEENNFDNNPANSGEKKTIVRCLLLKPH